MKKTCRLCGIPKPFVDFYDNPQMRSGKANECKSCVIEAGKKRYASNPASYRALYIKRRDRLAKERADKGCTDCGQGNPMILRDTKLGVLCINCHRKRRFSAIPIGMISRGKQKRRAIVKLQLRAVKSSSGCAICREKDGRCLDFHHTDPRDKTGDVSRMANERFSAALEEAAKCIVLCANCHWILEMEKFGKIFTPYLQDPSGSENRR